MSVRRIAPIAASLAVGLAGLAYAAAKPAAPVIPPEVTCVRVVDGDTIVIEGDDGKRASVRLIGVDTPEVKHPRKPVEPHGPEASAYTKSRLTGRKVRLVRDGTAGDLDRYGRRLAYIYVGDECINETLIRLGHGRAYRDYPMSPVERTRYAIVEHEAREAGRGLWADDDGGADR